MQRCTLKKRVAIIIELGSNIFNVSFTVDNKLSYLYHKIMIYSVYNKEVITC